MSINLSPQKSENGNFKIETKSNRTYTATKKDGGGLILLRRISREDFITKGYSDYEGYEDSADDSSHDSTTTRLIRQRIRSRRRRMKSTSALDDMLANNEHSSQTRSSSWKPLCDINSNALIDVNETFSSVRAKKSYNVHNNGNNSYGFTYYGHNNTHFDSTYIRDSSIIAKEPDRNVLGKFIVFQMNGSDNDGDFSSITSSKCSFSEESYSYE